jgi:predicted AAA+ superfamily ATPase
VFFTIRKELKQIIINKINEELKCILIIGPRASGKTSTILDLQNDYEDTLFFK